MSDYSGHRHKVACPVCRNHGKGPGGTVVRAYQPYMRDGKMVGTLKPLNRDRLECRQCGTVLLERVDGEWVTTHRVK